MRRFLLLIVLTFVVLTATARPQQQRLRLNFTPEAEKFAAATQEYVRIWQAEGTRILDAMEELTGFKYEENEVNVIVFEGVSNSGYKETPMKMRASYPVDVKKATLIHELGHRHNSQLHSKMPQDFDTHKLLFLWLYDVWVKLYGKAFAEDAVRVESERKGLYDYEAAWRWALSISAEERSAKFREIVRQNQ